MYLIELQKKQYTVAVLGEETEGEIVSEVLVFLDEIPANYRKSADGFISLFEQFAEHGRRGLTPPQFHEANKEEDIWEFIKGDLRIYCFFDPQEKSLVLLSNATIKKRQKAHPKDINTAVRARDAYLRAVRKGQLETITAEEQAVE